MGKIGKAKFSTNSIDADAALKAVQDVTPISIEASITAPVDLDAVAAYVRQQAFVRGWRTIDMYDEDGYRCFILSKAAAQQHYTVSHDMLGENAAALYRLINQTLDRLNDPKDTL